jgi:hypothetical protein
VGPSAAASEAGAEAEGGSGGVNHSTPPRRALRDPVPPCDKTGDRRCASPVPWSFYFFAESAACCSAAARERSSFACSR